MQQLSRNLRQVEPIVRHGIQELQTGAPVDHTLREVALMASLVGAGATPTQAIRAVEQIEPQLLSYGGYERAEVGFHGGMGGKAGMGKPAGYPQPGMGMPVGYPQPGMGMPVGYAQPGMGMPVGYAQPGMGMPGYGKPVGYGAPVGTGKGYGPGMMMYGAPMGGVPMGR